MADDELCIHCELFHCESCEELHALGVCCCGREVDDEHDLCPCGYPITEPCDVCDEL